MTIGDIVSSIIAILSLITGLFAWVAKIRWSNEFRESKEAQIQALEQQVQTYKDFTADKIKSIFVSTKEFLENRVIELEKKLIEEKEHRGELIESEIHKRKQKKIDLIKDEINNLVWSLEKFNKINENMDNTSL